MTTPLFQSSITSLPLLSKGKVRDIYAVDADKLLIITTDRLSACLLYTSDAADERSSVDLGGRRIIKKITIEDYKGTVGLVQNTHHQKRTHTKTENN